MVFRLPEMDTVRLSLPPYQELEESVWLRNTCAGCRACISVCPAGTLAYDPALNRPHQVTLCVDCKACLDVCPRRPQNLKNIGSSEILGPYLDIKNARSRKNSGRFQNGGAVTALLTAALEEGLVDCALVMGEDRWAQKSYPRVVYDISDLEKCAGSKYTSNAVLEPIQDIVKDVNNIALVGTPCTVQAMGLLRKSSNEFAMKLAHKVRFLLGLFCFEAFDDQLIPEVTRRLCIPPWRIDKMIAGEGMMTITLRDGETMTIPLQELSGYVKPGCMACADFTAKLSDISVGSTGSTSGSSVVILRTPEGEGLFKIAEEMGFIEADNGVNVETIEKVGKLKLKRNGF